MGTTNRPNAAAAALSRSGDVHRSCYREVLRLSSQKARLSEELARARARHEDLIQSAEMWIRLYERQLARANRLADEAAAGAGEGPRP